MDRKLAQSAIHFAVGTALVLGAFGLSNLLSRLVALELRADVLQTFQLVYLPHGVNILLTWIYGWLAVPILLPASMLSVFLLVGQDGFGPDVALIVTLKVLAVPLTFDLFRIGGVDARSASMALNWRVLFLIGLLGAVLNNLIRHWLGCCGTFTGDELLASFTGAILGDMIGLAVVMVGAMLFFRALRRDG